jgi:hypothetical protein
MQPYRKEAELLLPSEVLAPELSALLAEGLVVEDGALYFVACRRSNPHLMGDTSLTGRESIINKLHLDDYVDTATDRWAALCVAHGLLLGREVLSQADSLELPFPVEVVTAVQSDTSQFRASTFRFYLRRPADPLLADDLEQYEGSAILVITAPGLDAIPGHGPSV